MSKSIGIDLGTTNSVVCVMHTEPEVVLNRENGRLTPSLVAFRRSKKSGDSFIVGQLAQNLSVLAQKDFVYSIKRLMGHGYKDAEVQQVIKEDLVSYIIEPSPFGDEDVCRVSIAGKLYTPSEISAMILKKLKEDAEHRLGEPVDSAVITVPAYFSERQKHATREAGVLAGLRVKKIIDEPTAAAIAFGIDQNDDKDRMILVFDLGGGTFDVSVLLMIGGIFNQMNIEGDMWLGGDDFDRLILNHALKDIEKEHQLSNLSTNEKFMNKLRMEARNAKEILSSQNSAEINFVSEDIKDSDGFPIQIEFEVTKKEFNEFLTPYINKSMDLAKKAISGANLETNDIDAILLVGGSSTIPAFQEALEDYFGTDKVLKTIDPMIGVAQGAAILAKSLTGVWCPQCQHENPLEAEKCEKCHADLSIVREHQETSQEDECVEAYGRTAKPYGIETEDGDFVVLIDKNSEYPTQKPYFESFKTAMADQRMIKIPVYEGFSPKAVENDFMGNIWFTSLPPGLPAQTPIDLYMSMDKDMIFTLECRIQGTDWSRKMELQHDGWQNKALNEAMNVRMFLIEKGVSGVEGSDIDHYAQEIEEAVKNKDQVKAQEYTDKIKDAQENIESKRRKLIEEQQVDWRTQLANILSGAEDNLALARPVIPTGNQQLSAFEQWLKEAKTALDNDDKANGQVLLDNWLEKISCVPIVAELFFADILSSFPNLDSSLAPQLTQARNNVISYLNKNDFKKFESEFGVLADLINEAIKSLGGPGEGDAGMDLRIMLKR